MKESRICDHGLSQDFDPMALEPGPRLTSSKGRILFFSSWMLWSQAPPPFRSAPAPQRLQWSMTSEETSDRWGQPWILFSMGLLSSCEAPYTSFLTPRWPSWLRWTESIGTDGDVSPLPEVNCVHGAASESPSLTWTSIDSFRKTYISIPIQQINEL